MELTLIRHAEPQWILDGKAVIDPPLSTRGLRQATLLGQRMKNESFDHIFTSPLVRTHQTAYPTLELHRRDLIIEPWLEEIREPSWHGEPAEKTIKAYREEMKRNAEDRWHGLHGGEPVRDFVARIHRGAEQFLESRGIRRLDSPLPLWHIENPGESVVFVAHAGTNSVIICHLLGLQPTPWEWERFVIGHASVTTIKAMKLGDGYTFSLINLSDLEHIPQDLRTR
jgi:probable phosphoglycerate mutase